MSARDTPTPRTDEAENDCALEDKNHPHTNWVPSMLARQLERELAATERLAEGLAEKVRALQSVNMLTHMAEWIAANHEVRESLSAWGKRGEGV